MTESAPIHANDAKLLQELSLPSPRADNNGALDNARKMHMQQLGKGSFATVFVHPYDSKKAVRITDRGDMCWFRFVAYLAKHKSKYFPTIYAHQPLKDGGAITIVEKLKEFNPSNLKGKNLSIIAYLALTDMDYIDKYKKKLTSKEVLVSVAKHPNVKKWIEKGDFYGYDPSLEEEAMKEFEISKMPFFVAIRHIVDKTKCHLDLHRENLMHRPDGSLVINDPIAWSK